MRWFKAFASVFILTIVGTQTGYARTERLGRADFANSCNSTVKSKVGEAALLLHSMGLQQAESNFREVETVDPRCAIAAWGQVLAET